jgi:GNAT superfamily N-acetyltransferase
MSLEVRYAQLDDYPRLSAFLDTYWAKDHVYVRQRSLFDWTFGRRDVWAHDGYSFALAEDHGEVVGILGGVPFVMNCFGRTSPGVWLANYMVCPDYRRGALAVRLLNMFRQPLFTVTIAFGVSMAAVPLYTALRARVTASSWSRRTRSKLGGNAPSRSVIVPTGSFAGLPGVATKDVSLPTNW